MSVGTELTGDIPDTIKPVAEKWGAALNSTFEFLNEGDNTKAEPEEIRQLFSIILQTAAAVFGPAEYDAAGQEQIVRMFRDELTAICEQFIQDKETFQQGRMQ